MLRPGAEKVVGRASLLSPPSRKMGADRRVPAAPQSFRHLVVAGVPYEVMREGQAAGRRVGDQTIRNRRLQVPFDGCRVSTGYLGEFVQRELTPEHGSELQLALRRGREPSGPARHERAYGCRHGQRRNRIAQLASASEVGHQFGDEQRIAASTAGDDAKGVRSDDRPARRDDLTDLIGGQGRQLHASGHPQQRAPDRHSLRPDCRSVTGSGEQDQPSGPKLRSEIAQQLQR